MVALGAAIGSGAAFWLLQDWLEGFAYHITLRGGFFVMATVLVLVVALVTVGSHALRAALANPVKALRQE